MNELHSRFNVHVVLNVARALLARRGPAREEFALEGRMKRDFS
jgi:hypothetical protein